MKVMSSLPDFFEPYIKPPSVIALPIQPNVYTTAFPAETYADFIDNFQAMLTSLPNVKGKDEDEAEEIIEKWEKTRDDFLNGIYKTCNFKDSRTRFGIETIDRLLEYSSHVLVLSLDASKNPTGFAILQNIENDTYLDVFCANVPGEAQKIMAKVEEIARKEGHKRITADAIHENLVKYYARYGFVAKDKPATYKNIVDANYIEKQLGGRSRILRLTKRLKVLSRRRRLHK
jgi:GGDEF domain-containing protein